MHLFSTKALGLKEFFDDKTPPYAILSHTWGPDAEELTFQDIKQGKIEKPGIGTVKLRGCLKQAQADGLAYLWNDTFCIDKSNLVQLSEAIRSMFRWYSRASVCYVYLGDVTADDARSPRSNFGASRWFTRGWTLQELLAPREVRFFNAEWKLLGTRSSLCSLIERATGIPRQFLLGITPLRVASVAQRMSWAARRETRRAEDRAYSLLGLFDVSVPVIYGEGGEQAFWRLQDQIMRTTRDDSILAWGIDPQKSPLPDERVPGRILAASPSDFAGSGAIVYHERAGEPISNLEFSGGSVRMRMRMSAGPADPTSGRTIGWLSCGPEHSPEKVVCIHLMPVANGGPDEYVRPRAWSAHVVLGPGASEDVTTALVHIRNNDDENQLSTAGPKQQYVLYDEQFTELGLEVAEVEPASSWDRDRAVITSAVNLDGSDAPPTLIRIRSVRNSAEYTFDDGRVLKPHEVTGLLRFVALERQGITSPPYDFILSLEFTHNAESSVIKIRDSLMVCRWDTSLSSISKMRDMLPIRIWDSRDASDGTLHLRVVLQTIPRQSILIIRPEALSSSPDKGVDVSAELDRIDLASRLITNLVEDGKRPKAEQRLHGQRRAATDALKQAMLRKKELKARIRELQAELDGEETTIRHLSGEIQRVDDEWMNLFRDLTPAESTQDLWDSFKHKEQFQGPPTADGATLLNWAVRHNYDRLAQRCIDELGLTYQTEPTVQDAFIEQISNYVKDTPSLDFFFGDNKNSKFIRELAEKAMRLANDPDTDLGRPEVLPKTIKITMHQQVILCDDSKSMGSTKGRFEKRWESQLRLARRIARTTTRILPDDEGVALRFIHQRSSESLCLDFDRINMVLLRAYLSKEYYFTTIGTTLRDSIMKPLVYDALAAGKLRRPLLVSILINDAPSDEPLQTLENTILHCGEMLVRKGHPRESVKFLIGRIGSKSEAAKFLEALGRVREDNPQLASVLHVFEGRIDEEFNRFIDNRTFDQWVVETLSKPLEVAEDTADG